MLQICRKIFERIIYNNTYNYLLENNSISQNQSGFKCGGFCINQLISITHDILNSLDKDLKVRVVFLEFLKLSIKLGMKDSFISDNLLNILIYFLYNRKKNRSQNSNLVDVIANLPQDSVMGPLLFLIYISNLSES